MQIDTDALTVSGDFTVDGGVVINEGVASGDTSIAGGTTDETIVSNLVGSLGAAITTLHPSEARGDLSIALGADNISNTTGAVTLGYDNISGGKGYYFSAINEDDRTVTLSSDQKEDSPTGNPGWKEGDRLFIINDNKYWLEVAADTTSNVISVVELPTGCEQVNYADIDTLVLKPNDKTVINVDRPEAGIIDMGWGSIGIGIQNTVVGNSAYALGYKNIIGGDFGVAFGQENLVGYKSLAVGNRNKAYGKDLLVIGKEISVNANRSIVAGYNNVVNGHAYNAVFGFSNRILETSEGHELISGWDNEITAGGFGAIIGTRGKNIAGNYNIIFGRDNTNTDGARNIISGDGNTNNGSNVIMGGKGNTASGSYHLIQGISNTVSTTMHGLAIFGVKNIVVTDGSLTSKAVEGLELIVGNDNQIHAGGYGAIIGSRNKNIEGNQNFITGADNTCKGARNILSGHLNTIDNGNRNIVAGSSNNVSGSNNLVIGSNHNIPLGVNNALVGGCYSDVTAGTVFAIGDGIAGALTNIFEVNKNKTYKTCVKGGLQVDGSIYANKIETEKSQIWLDQDHDGIVSIYGYHGINLITGN